MMITIFRLSSNDEVGHLVGLALQVDPLECAGGDDLLQQAVVEPHAGLGPRRAQSQPQRHRPPSTLQYFILPHHGFLKQRNGHC